LSTSDSKESVVAFTITRFYFFDLVDFFLTGAFLAGAFFATAFLAGAFFSTTSSLPKPSIEIKPVFTSHNFSLFIFLPPLESE
jgi:hypothetical protein